MDRVKNTFKPSLLVQDDENQDDHYSGGGGDGWSDSGDSD